MRNIAHPCLEHYHNGHMKVVYHKDGLSTHALRFAKRGEWAENPYGGFVTPTIISWYSLTGDGISNIEMRTKLNNFNYGSGSLPLKRSNFFTNLNKFKPSSYPRFEAEGNCLYTNRFSEESSSGQACPAGYVVTGIRCSGRYCDNKQLHCCMLPGLTVSGSAQYSRYFSEEGVNFSKKNGEVVVGMRCSGRYCDNISLLTRIVQGKRGIWTTPFSEEGNGEGNCSFGSYVSGVRCTGRYCDNLSLYCEVFSETISDAVFNDMEANYRNWFPPTQSSQTQGEYYYRSYSNGSYLLEWNNDLWYNIEGSGWRKWGVITDWYSPAN